MGLLFCFALIISLQKYICKSKITDWLINDLNSYPKVTLKNCTYGKSPNDFPCIQLSNSLISRKFITSPNFFTIEYNSYLSDSSYTMGSGIDYILRSPFSPEAVIGFNYKNYSIGGVSYINNSNTTAAFWTASWLKKDNIMINDTTWLFDSYTTSTTLNKLYEWTPGTRHSFDYIHWPPKGLQLTVTFKAPLTAPLEIQNNIKIKVIYEMYQGMPILSKQVMIESSSPTETSNIYLTYIQVEELKTNIPYGLGENDYKYWTPDQGDDKWAFMNTQWGQYPGWLFLWNDYAHLTQIVWYDDADKVNFRTNNYGGYEPMVISSFATWDEQTNWAVKFDPTLPGTMNGIFKSFRTFELIFDSYNWERQSLGMRRLMTYMSPRITESPIYTQTMNMSNSSVYRIIDQCALSGFEMLTFSFDELKQVLTDKFTPSITRKILDIESKQILTKTHLTHEFKDIIKFQIILKRGCYTEYQLNTIQQKICLYLKELFKTQHILYSYLKDENNNKSITSFIINSHFKEYNECHNYINFSINSEQQQQRLEFLECIRMDIVCTLKQ